VYDGEADNNLHGAQFGGQLAMQHGEHGVYQGLTVFGTHHPADRALFYKRFAGELHAHATGQAASTSDQLHAARAITNVAGGLGEEEE
jgi:hypothetical protein